MTRAQRERYVADFQNAYGVDPTNAQLMSYAAWRRQQEREARLHSGLDGWQEQNRILHGGHGPSAHDADQES